MRAGLWLVVALGGAAYAACSEADVIVAEPSDTGGFGGDPLTASIVSTTIGPVTTSGPSTTSSTGGGDPSCFQKCKNDHANGVIPYLDLVGCIYCGACYDVCPVRIDIPEVLVHLRGKVVEHGGLPNEERVMMGSLGWAFGGPRRLAVAERTAAAGAVVVARKGRIGKLPLPGMLGRWFRWRDLPAPARQSFRSWWRKHGETRDDA